MTMMIMFHLNKEKKKLNNKFWMNKREGNKEEK